MATAYIREYEDISSPLGKATQAPQEPGVADQTVTTSGTTAQSAAFNARTNLIAISTPATQAVAYVVGVNPTALVTSLRLPSNSVFFVAVKPTHKIALIDVT